MKSLKKIIVGVIACLMLVVTCFGAVGCGGNIKTLELTVSVYDFDNDETVETTLTVDLYAHLAPVTVDAVIDSVEAGYYDDAIFYKLDAYSSQIMLGDLKYGQDGLVQNDMVRPEIKGEFTRGGTTGSNLTSKKGSIGLWRTWYASDDSYKTSSNALSSGRATWYIPTAEIAGYNEWFCVFAQIDLTDATNSETLALIIDAFETGADYDEYTVYYTGEYDAEKPDENHGLTYNVVDADQFDKEQIDDLFVAEGDQYVCYNHYTVKVPKIVATDAPAVKILSAKIK